MSYVIVTTVDSVKIPQRATGTTCDVGEKVGNNPHLNLNGAGIFSWILDFWGSKLARTPHPNTVVMVELRFKLFF